MKSWWHLWPLNEGFLWKINIFYQSVILTKTHKLINSISEKIDKILKNKKYLNSKYNLSDNQWNIYRILNNYWNNTINIYRYNKEKNTENQIWQLDYKTHLIDNDIVYEIIIIKSNQNFEWIIDLLINNFLNYTKKSPSFIITNNALIKTNLEKKLFTEIVNNILVYWDINIKDINKIKNNSTLKN
jgi:hypothetical protein